MQPNQPQQTHVVGGHIAQPSATSPFGDSQPMVYAQPPSQVSKIIGICVMVYGGLQIVGGLLSAAGGPVMNEWLGGMGDEISEALMPTWVYVVQGLVGMIVGGILMYGGWMMVNFRKMGIWVCFGAIAISAILGIVMSFFTPLTGVEESGMDPEAMRAIIVGSSVFGALCGGLVCGLLTAIPLFVSNNGME